MHPSRILVPYDFSAAAEVALRWAAQLHATLAGSSLHILHVMSTLPAAGAAVAIAPPVPSAEDITQMEAALRQATAAAAPDATIEVQLAGDIATGVLQAAEAAGADLIVMGTSGRGGVKRMVLGSVADYLVRNARCPVVTMRAQ